MTTWAGIPAQSETALNIFLDIETLPTADPVAIASITADAQAKKSEIKAPSNYKDEAKIAEFIAAKHQEIDAGIAEQIKRTSFDGMYGRIACICYAIDDGEVHAAYSDDEKELLSGFYANLSEVTAIPAHNRIVERDVTYVGHNIIGFDLPFLKHRSIIQTVKPIASIRKAFSVKQWGTEVADTMLMWSADREKRASMDKLCRALGIPGKGDFDGSMVADTWPTDPQKVIDYCKADVERTRAMFRRMTFAE